jgi:cytidylate kinase
MNIENITNNISSSAIHTKVEYVVVGGSIFNLKDAFYNGELYYSEFSNGKTFVNVNPTTSMAEHYLINNFQTGNLYRRMETPITEGDIDVNPSKNSFIAPQFTKTNTGLSSAVDKSVGIQEVTLRLDETLVEDIKALAQLKKVRYKVLLRQILQNFVDNNIPTI